MWTLIQAVFDLFATLGFFLIIMRMNRAPKDDPRMSRGLQLLQSKISVLEDLSDRTETQANQLSAILEQKCKEVQAKVTIAEQSVHEIRVSMERSLEVAKIFQDKIPHQEIIERQNTLKYVQAARLAHQGYSAEEIATEVDLPKGEIEFIAKVNKDQLVFNEDQLPDWARKSVAPLNELHPPSYEAAAAAAAQMSAQAPAHQSAQYQQPAAQYQQQPQSQLNQQQTQYQQQTQQPPQFQQSAPQYQSQYQPPQQQFHASAQPTMAFDHASIDEEQFRPYQAPAMMQPSNQMPAPGAGQNQTPAAEQQSLQAQQAQPQQQFAQNVNGNEQETARLRTEMEMAERQRLVENLSRLQSEMHNLDQQLAREIPPRDLSEIFDAPKLETSSMQKLGAEFRKACEEAEVENSRGGILPPLDHLAAMIPNIFTHLPGSPDFAPTPAPVPAPEPYLSYLETASDQPGASDFANAHAPRAAIDAFVSVPALPEIHLDPAVLRAVAQAKVQAALQSAKPGANTPLVREVSAELAEARSAAATFAAAPVPMRGEATTNQSTNQSANHSPYATSNAAEAAAKEAAAPAKPAGPVIRKVQFPRIDAPVK